MSVIYSHLSYEDYKNLEKQMREFAETSHTTTGNFYHKSIRLKISNDLIWEFHGPLVGGYGHNAESAKDQLTPVNPKREAVFVDFNNSIQITPAEEGNS
jgi:hypothetical protein